MNSSFGQLEPGAMRNAGQYTAWNLRMSLASSCSGGGQNVVGEVLAVARVGERGRVVEQRVDPDVEDLLVVPRHVDAPA